MSGVGGAARGIFPRARDRRLCRRERAAGAAAFRALRPGEIEIKFAPLRAREWPFVLVTEMIGAAASADRELDRRLLHHAVVDALEPMIEEAQLIVAAVFAVEGMVVRAAMNAQLLVFRG